MNGQYDEDEAFREILNKQEQLTLFESVYVDFWGTGLNQVRTEHTGHTKMAWTEHTDISFRKFAKTTTEI